MSSTTSAGVQSLIANAISSGDHQTLIPTAIAPIDTVAQNVTTHSIEFLPAIATRSPFVTPWASRWCAALPGDLHSFRTRRSPDRYGDHHAAVADPAVAVDDVVAISPIEGAVEQV